LKKNILFAPIHYILDAENSGSEFSWSFEMYKAFKKAILFESVFITGGIRGIQDNSIINIHMFSPKKLDVSFVRVVLFHLNVFLESIKVIRKKNIDLVHHVLPFGLGTSFNLLAVFSSVPVIIGPIQPPLEVFDTDVDSSDALGFKEKKITFAQRVQSFIFSCIKPVFKFFFYITLKKAKKIIVVNDYARKQIKAYGISDKKIQVIPPGVHVSQYKKSKSVNTKIRFVAVGHLRKRKAFEKIIEGFSALGGNDKSLSLDIIGDGPQRMNLEALVKKLKLGEIITFKGFMPHDKIKNELCSYDLLINMSKSEGFATICLEALASGLGVISTPVGGFIDVVVNGVNGYIVDGENTKELTKKIDFLVSHKKILQSFKQNSRKIAEEKYDWKACIIPQYLALYKKVL
jgi:glycosyltransferase involved in cell wall biosynthesis